ncbi:alpha/beta hydrolase [Aquimarina sp. 2201CG5-10]|uniref:alpha/beta hydrolase n=1 Tax=Aquimarina callyspongiae TaxID=3098150 RepID=UPI002AB4EDF9|nr:alpha/beta fold hydrolase [Aquimarina sp. 2201CG5-10]MDY8135615.1 alpha/beta fold hydrolase [Aquimarina sp. 2201CG5-10]
MHKLKKFVLWIAAIYGVISLLLYIFQEQLLFHPEKLDNNYTFQFDYSFDELFLETSDGAKLNGLHFKVENSKGVILYFHGNKGSLRRWGSIATFFVEKQYDVVIMDYRGYGKSQGKMTEEYLYSDAQQFYEYTKQYYPENKINIYGRSLGTGIAVKTASVNNPGNLILETPYYNLENVAKNWLPIFPVKWLLRYKIPSNAFIKDVSCRTTIYHGTKDKVVPYESGKQLFDSISNQNKRLITVEGGGHNDLIMYREYLKTIDDILENQ